MRAIPLPFARAIAYNIPAALPGMPAIVGAPGTPAPAMKIADVPTDA